MLEFDYSKEPGKHLLNRNLNKAGEPLISIITPYYNAGKHFEQTYNCVMNQTFPWFEWIIVDDGSTDFESVNILKILAESDMRIKVIRQDNKGQSAARNNAISQSVADIVVPLDADDLIVPTYLERVFFGLYFNSEASWCYTDSVGFQEQEYLWAEPFSAARMKTENILTCTAAIRKKELLEVGGYDASEKHYDEDWRLWLMLLSKSKKPVHLSGPSFWYRRTHIGMLRQVQNDSDLRRRSREMIRKAAESVDTKVVPREYPSVNPIGKYIAPKTSAWDRKVFKSHEKINVMMLLPWMVMGGADLFNLDVVRKIDKNRFEMSILTTVPAEQTWRQQFEEHITDIFDLPSFLDIQNYAEFICYFIRSREIDIVFLSNSYYGYYLVPWLRKEFPDIAIIDYVHMEEWYWRNGGFARTSGVMGEILEKTYVCNERTRRVLINDFGRKEDSVETLYIGVDKDKFDETKVKPGLVKEQLGIVQDRPVILFPCRIHPQKRPFLMLEIAKGVKGRIEDIAFVVVGDGPQLEEMKIKTKDAGLTETVYFAGRQSDMLPYYKDASITLICSLKEGLALTAYESLSMGTPVITSDVGGQAELIDDTVGAVLPLLQSEAEELDAREFPPEEVRQYVEAIERILSDKDLYKAMCKACRQKIEQSFSSEIMINKLQDIFEKLVNEQDILNKRAKISEITAVIPHFVDDYLTIYSESEAAQQECENAWRAKEWVCQQYKNELRNEQGTNARAVPADPTEAQRKLEEIYQMRTWRLVEKYRHVMDNTFLGQILKKARDGFRKQGQVEA